MQKIKKAASLILSLTMAVSLIFTSGCAKKDAPKPQGEDKKAVEQKTDSVSEKTELSPVELVYYLPFGAQQAGQDEVFQKANEIIKNEINATVKFNVLDQGTYKEKMPVMIASGEPMDMMFTSHWLNDYYQNVAKGALAPLDDLLKQYGQSLINDIPQLAFDSIRIDGKLYGIPNYQSIAGRLVYVLKKDLVEKYKFDYANVKSYKDLEPYLKTLKENEKEIYPIEHRNIMWSMVFPEKSFYQLNNNLPGMISLGDKSAKVFSQYATPEYKEFVETMYDWYQKGYIRKDVLNVKSTTAERKAGKYGIIIGGAGPYPGASSRSHEIANGYPWVEVQIGQPWVAHNTCAASVTAISALSKNKERAVMYYDLVNKNTELANLLAYGIEGKHYDKVNDKKIDLKKESGYFPNRPWAYLNTFKIFVTEPNPDNHLELIQKEAELALKNPAPIMGVSLSIEKVKQEVAQVTTVYEEMGKGLEAGVLDPKEYLPKYLEKLEQAGASKIIAELQSQIDAQKK